MKGSGQVYGENHPAAKLTEAIVLELRRTIGTKYTPGIVERAAEKYGVAPGTISMAIHGQTWKHLGKKIKTKFKAGSAKKPKCRRGHHMVPSNVLEWVDSRTGQPRRACRTCLRRRTHEHYLRHRAKKT